MAQPATHRPGSQTGITKTLEEGSLHLRDGRILVGQDMEAGARPRIYPLEGGHHR